MEFIRRIFDPIAWPDSFMFFAGAASFIVFGMFLVVTIVRIQGRGLRSAARRALGDLESAARLGAPLPEMMEAAADTERGRYGTRMWNFSRQLRAGRSVRDALAISMPHIPARHRELIGAAERIGRLPEGLTSLLARERLHQQLAARVVDWFYPILILCLLLGAVSLMVARTWPIFHTIYSDFDSELPLYTRSIFEGAGFTIVVGATMALAFGALMVIMITGIVWFHRRVGRPLPEFLSSAAHGLVSFVYRLPVIGSALLERQLADVCFVIASGLRSAMPLHAAIGEALSLRLDPVLRWRLMRWSHQARDGDDNHRAARRAGMPRLISGMLSTGQAAAAPAEAFEFLYRYYNGRFSRSLELLRSAIVPATVLIVGAATGLLVVAMLMPLFSLIDQVAAEVYP